MTRVETVTKLQNRFPEKPLSTFDLLKAYQMFQQILSQGLMSEGNTTDLMFRIQDRDNALTSRNSDSLANAMDKLTKDSGTAGTWNKVSLYGGLGAMGFVFFLPSLGDP